MVCVLLVSCNRQCVHVHVTWTADPMAAPSFWAFSIQPGARLQQQVPKGASICLTGATLADPSNQRTVLTASVGGVSAVLCNLFGRAGHEVARLGQPFHEDFELTVARGSQTVHVSGFARGKLGPAEIVPHSVQDLSPVKNGNGNGPHYYHTSERGRLNEPGQGPCHAARAGKTSWCLLRR